MLLSLVLFCDGGLCSLYKEQSEPRVKKLLTQLIIEFQLPIETKIPTNELVSCCKSQMLYICHTNKF